MCILLFVHAHVHVHVHVHVHILVVRESLQRLKKVYNVQKWLKMMKVYNV